LPFISEQSGLPEASRRPNGGWKINTSRMLKVMSKFDEFSNYLNRIPILNVPVPSTLEMMLQNCDGYHYIPIKG
jgi:hypothetical protein